jgi:hypothetical protein
MSRANVITASFPRRRIPSAPLLLLTMLLIEALRVLICLCAGEIFSGVGVLPFPGSAIGLVLLLANLALIGEVTPQLGRLADNVLSGFCHANGRLRLFRE